MLPITSLLTKHSRLMDAFVEDTSLGSTDPGWSTVETMVANLPISNKPGRTTLLLRRRAQSAKMLVVHSFPGLEKLTTASSEGNSNGSNSHLHNSRQSHGAADEHQT